MTTALHRRIKQSLHELVIPPLQNIITNFIPIVKLEFWEYILQHVISSGGPIVTFSGTSNKRNNGREYPRFTGYQVVNFGIGRRIFGHPNNPEFVCTLDFTGLKFESTKSYTIEIDPDLNKILRVIEY